MIFGSVCSGIEAASLAWGPLGWRCAFVAEIDPAPSAVLAHRYPEVPNLGDFTQIQAAPGPIDLLVGGTPCQSFSVAGLRGGMVDARGNLTLEFLRLAGRARPAWVVWENVPGVLSSNGGRDFGAFLGGLAELGYGWAYRVLDAQHFGVPQRRRRVFVVGRLGDWRGAVAVLFERESLSGNPPPRREERADVAASLTGSLGRRGGQPDGGDTKGHLIARSLAARNTRLDGDTETFIPDVAYCLKAEKGRNENGSHVGQGWNTNYIAHTLRADGFDASEDGTGRGTPLVPVPFIVNAAESCAKASHARPSETARCIDSTGSFANAQGGTVVMDGPATFDERNVTSWANRSRVEPGLPCHTLHGNAPSLIGAGVRRLTPRECERLQGFPDDWTLAPYRGKPMADGPRYKMIGNSMAIPPMRWLGRRIHLVDGFMRGKHE